MTRSNNKLYTLSYFRKRLKDAGIYARILVRSYGEGDKRYWTIAIGEQYIIMCTCFNYADESGDQVVLFKFSDGNQKMIIDRNIQTESMNVIIEMLEKLL
jgi:hypothetical protein